MTNTKLTLMLFYSNINQVSLKSRIILNDFIKNHFKTGRVILKEVEFDQDIQTSNKYGITGTPTTLFFKNGILLKRHFGEITKEELIKLTDSINKINSKSKI